MSKKIGRNDPCPCGSGKKYKHCCLGKEAANHSLESHNPHAIASALRQHILGFVIQPRFRNEFNRALEQFWGSKRRASQFPFKEESQNSLFMEWYIHDYRLVGSGKRLIDLYAQEEGSHLPTVFRSLLKQLQDPLFGVYEVTEVERGVVSQVRDIFQGNHYQVHDVSTSHKLQRWDLLLGRIVQEGDTHCFTGAIQVFGQWDKGRLTSFVNKLFKEYSSQHTNPIWQEFLRDNSYRFASYVRRLSEHPRKLRLRTSDGEEFCVAQAFYRVGDRKAVETRLKRHASLLYIGADEDDRSAIKFDWLGQPTEKLTSYQPKGAKGIALTTLSHSAPGAKGRVILGNITLSNDRLVLSCFSRERLEAGKKLLEEYLGDLVMHVADSKENWERWLKEQQVKPAPRKSPQELPRAVQERLILDMLEKHYQRWVNESVPALGGQTPRQAVRNKQGRAKVIALIKDLENREAHRRSQGDVVYDVGKLKASLGLRDDEFLEPKLSILPVVSDGAKPTPITSLPQPGDSELLKALETIEDPDLAEQAREKLLRQVWAKRTRVP